MFSRRQLVTSILGTLATRTVAASVDPFLSSAGDDIFRIAFGSCVSQRRSQPVWASITAKKPDVFLMMGDGVYPEHEGEDLPVLESLERAYKHARTRSELRKFRDIVKTIAIWDDNDYGGSDIGASFEHRCRSRELFLEFWADPKEAKIRRRDSGIYGLWEFGEAGRRTQVIVPDLRFCRSEWAQTEHSVRAALGDNGFGPYKPTLDSGATMLGDAQWRWLEACLRRPAELRVFLSSIQFVPEGRGWESWSNFPLEKQRLLNSLREYDVDGFFILSGDTHYAEISLRENSGVGYPLWEATSSGLTESWPTPGPNPNRVGDAYPRTNFGMLTVNWLSDEPILVAEIFAEDGARLRQQAVLLSSLRSTN